MKMSNKVLIIASFFFLYTFATLPIALRAAGPSKINLGDSGDFVILAKTGISTTAGSSVEGNIGVSPAAASYITGFALDLTSASAFSTSALVQGKVYAPGYADPTPAMLTGAVLDMQTAYTDGAGRPADVTELGSGNIGGLTITPGVYKWGTNVVIPSDVTISGGSSDVWIFVIAQNLTQSSATQVVLSGGARADNIFWVVGGQTTIGTTSVFNGNILGQTAIVLNTGAELNGRALAQTAVTLDSNTVTLPSFSSSSSNSTSSSNITTTSTLISNQDSTNTNQNDTNTLTNTINQAQTQNQNSNSLSESEKILALETQLQSLRQILWSLQQKELQNYPANYLGPQIRMIATDLEKGNYDNNVKILQQFLISENKGPAAKALGQVGVTTYFGAFTHEALAEFQKSAGINPTGYFGPITRNYIDANY